MPDSQLADKAWRAMAAVVFDNRDAWRRSVIETTGLPFSRVRVLRRLANRGLVVRQADPTNRRCKVISLTERGREVVTAIDGLDDPAPPVFGALSPSELQTLQAILAKLTSH